MFYKTVIAAAVAFAAIAPLNAFADGGGQLSSDGIYDPGGSSNDCEFAEGWIWDDDSDDFISNWILDCG